MLKRRSGFLIALMVIVCSFLVALPALAESNVRIVRLSYIDGDAQINTTNQDDGFSHAVLNTPVTAGMWVYTPNGAHAEIQFENGNTVRLVDDAQVQFEKLALADNGGKINIINVDHGVVYLNFDKVAKEDQITIKAGGKTFAVDKASRVRVTAGEKNVVVSVFKGDAKLQGEKPAEIKGKESLTLAVATPDEFKVGKGIDEFGSDTWNTHRDGELSAMAFKNTPNSLRNQPGMYDAQFAYLGAYGNYAMIPGYGWGWQPFGMGMGWDPFMNGVWNYDPAFGYGFVSPYAWGWAPYRYGMWNYIPAYGWMWMPGSMTMTAWNVGPRYGTVPAGFKAPVAPTVATHPVKSVVVGHPPNVRPEVMSGHAEVASHAAFMKQSVANRTMVTTVTPRAMTPAAMQHGAAIAPRPTTSATSRPSTGGGGGGGQTARPAPMAGGHAMGGGGARPSGTGRPK